MTKTLFDYNEAFSRNVGWLTPDEQQILRYKKVAIAGLGGVGGNHLITLTRLGVGKFNISDFDTYALANFNRQIGATMDTVDQPKLDVLKKQAEAVNPEIEINSFPAGINEDNVDAFLENVDLYVDSLDFFVLDVRRLLFSKCAEKGIPAITAAPLGMGCAFLAFLPGQMTFEEYFQLEGHDEKEKLIRFLVGLAPRALQNNYLIYPQTVDLVNHKGPSTPMAVELCAGIADTQALKILLNRGDILAAPWSLHYDAFRNKFVKNWRPWGNKNPIQKLALSIGRKKFGEAYNTVEQHEPEPQSILEKILNLARWAPSGDNGQPWRFKIINEHQFETKITINPLNPYEYKEGKPTIISTGMLIETIRIAASQFGLKLGYKVEAQDYGLLITCSLSASEGLETDELLPYIKVRSVDRNSYSHQSLSKKDIEALSNTLHPSLEIKWFESFSDRMKIVKLNAMATDIRLRLKSCYQVHIKIVDWESKNSTKGVPAGALGLDKLTLSIMQWAMAKWERMNFLNNYLGGTLTARLQMDLLPGINCAAHFAVFSNKEPETAESIIEAGASLQRFWLTATRLSLVLQPGLAPLCFANRVLSPEVFGQDSNCLIKAKNLAHSLESTIAQPKGNLLFLARIGCGKSKHKTRSTRLELKSLITK